MDDRTAPATKGDLADTEERIVGLLANTEERLVDLLRDTETKLLNAFYGYAKSNDRRVLETEGNEAVLRSRLATLETRITEIEGRLNMPPQQ